MDRTLGCIIVAANDTNDRNRYFSYDYKAGGCSCWTFSFNEAHLFSTEKDAEKVLKSEDFVKSNKSLEEDTFPPNMVWKGAELCNSKIKGELYIAIKKLKLSDSILEKTFKAEIKEIT